jgi:hypothetical protein
MNNDICSEYEWRSYEALSKEFLEKVSRAIELVPLMYNRLTKVDKIPHKEAVKKILDDHHQVPGFSSRNILRYLPSDNPSVPHRVTSSWRNSSATPNNISRRLSNTEQQSLVDRYQSQNEEDKIQSVDYNESSKEKAELRVVVPMETDNITYNKIPSKGLKFKIFKEKYELLYLAMGSSNAYIRIEFDFNGTFESVESDITIK